jgi:predicted RNase H-like HicB family nuclease
MKKNAPHTALLRTLAQLSWNRRLLFAAIHSREYDIEWKAGFDMIWLKGIKIMNFTAVFQKVPGGYVGFVEELPGANTQGTDLDETRKNLAEAVKLILDANRQLAEESLAGLNVIREPFLVPA